MRNKWLLITGLFVVAVFCLATKGLKLGLDLRGGIHLVLGVATDDAVRRELDIAAGRLATELVEKQVTATAPTTRVVFEPEQGIYQVRVSGLTDDVLARAQKIAAAVLGDLEVGPEGSELVAKLSVSAVARQRSDAIDQALTTIRERVDATGVAEAKIQREGMAGDRIVVQLPGVQNPEQVKSLIKRVAFLEIRLVSSGPSSTREAALAAHPNGLPANLQLLEGDSKAGGLGYYLIERAPIITGADLARALPSRDQYGGPAVSFTLNGEGARKFGDGTGRNVGRLLAVVLDGYVEQVATIRSKITDSGIIEGDFTEQESRDLALVLRSGALPAKIQYLEERSVGPWLGRLSIEQGVRTGIVGLVLITILMLIMYRRSGANAVFALCLNALFLLGALSILDATLTLPGIAGFVLTLGMAVDANILVFEAIRENLRGGATVKRAIEDGFARALTTIVDSNLTTLLAAGALWMLGSGPVRGFGVTLFLGLTVNIFTAYFVSKTVFESTALRRDWKPGETLSI